MEDLVKPILRGRRFDDHTIPVDVLKDISVLGDFIVATSKWVYKNENPDRERIPRNFTSQIEIKLSGIEPGSAIPIIKIALLGNLLFNNFGHQEYYKKATDIIIEAIYAAGNGGDVTKKLPTDLLGYFNKFGKGLLEGEEIIFTTDRGTPNATFNHSIRKKILSYIDTEVIEQPLKLRCTVHALNVDKLKGTFKHNGEDYDFDFNENMNKLLIKSLSEYRERHSKIIIYGVGLFDKSENLKSIHSVSDITEIDKLDVPTRLFEFKKLKNGWIGPDEGVGFSEENLDWLAKIFDHNFPDDLPLPFTYPTPDGTIQFEWDIKGSQASFEVDLTTKTGLWHVLYDNHHDESRTLDISSDQGWFDLSELLTLISNS